MQLSNGFGETGARNIPLAVSPREGKKELAASMLDSLQTYLMVKLSLPVIHARK